jgi:hypothetical protein
VLGLFDIFALTSDTEQMSYALIEAMAAGLPVIATDWDVGFKLRYELVPVGFVPLPDISPGAEYVVECSPKQGVSIREVLVRDFQLVRISAGGQTTHVESCLERNKAAPRLYRLDTAITVPAGEWVAIHLRNDADIPLKQKDAVLISFHVGDVHVPMSHEGPPSSCPTCDACTRKERHRLFGNGGTYRYCEDPWHAGPIIHTPRLGRELLWPRSPSGIMGCSCGAEVTGTPAFAAHVDVPVEAVSAILALADLAYDLADPLNTLDRAEAQRRIERCTEFKR